MFILLNSILAYVLFVVVVPVAGLHRTGTAFILFEMFTERDRVRECESERDRG